MKNLAKYIVILVGVLSFSIPTVSYAQVDPVLWSMLNDLQDELAILYNRANDIQDGVVVAPTTFDTNIAFPTCTAVNLTIDMAIGSTDASTGGQVTLLQSYLQNQGYFNAGVTGYYGPITAQAVEQWKSAHGITRWSARSAKQYGVVDQIMRAMLFKNC